MEAVDWVDTKCSGQTRREPRHKERAGVQVRSHTIVEKTEEVLAGEIFEKQKEVRMHFEGTAGTGRQRLVNRGLEATLIR